MKHIAVYPGSFDPITNGHLDILKRALEIFDEVILLLAVSAHKNTLFTVEERLQTLREVTKDMDKVRVDYTEGLSVHYAHKHGAVALVRGLRAASDFEYEFKLAAGNRYVDKEIDMVFFMASSEYTFLSSSTLKELHAHGESIASLVPEPVVESFKRKFK